VIFLGILVATAVAFVISAVFYALVPPAPAAVPGSTTGNRPRPWQFAAEVVRSALVASLVAGLLRAAGWDGTVTGVRLGLALTVLPVVLLAGSVVWERVPVRTANTHALDWLLKLAAVGAVVGAFA
jgi:hypothetical protein